MSDSATRFKGKPTGSKRVAWSEPLRLPEVKAVSRALGCSMNDMLLSCVAGAMRHYLADKGDRTEGVEIRALAPIDLREPGDVSLGNRFGIVAVLLPVGVEHPLERLKMVRQRMLALKTSYEPAVTLGLFAALGYLPKIVQDQLFDLLPSRATAVMTNVPGPTETLTIAGSSLKQMLFWVPQSGDIGIGVSILSYAGKVQFGLITDAALTPDPEAVVWRFAEEFESISIIAARSAEAPAAEEGRHRSGFDRSRSVRRRRRTLPFAGGNGRQARPLPLPPSRVPRRASASRRRASAWRLPRRASAPPPALICRTA